MKLLSEIYSEEVSKIPVDNGDYSNGRYAGARHCLDTITPVVAIAFAEWIVSSDSLSLWRETSDNEPTRTTAELFELFLKEYKA